MAEVPGLFGQLLVRSTLIVVACVAAGAWVGRAQPRLAHRILAGASLALLLLPWTLAGAPRIEVDLGSLRSEPGPIASLAPGLGAAEAREAPWSHPRYVRRSGALLRILLVGYLAGLTFRLSRLAGSWARARRLLREAEPGADSLVTAAASMGWIRPRCRTHLAARVPFTTGLARPCIVLPRDATVWPEQRLRAALAHEIAHARHHDPLWSAVSGLAVALYWFHPGVWLLDHRLRVLAEFASDDEAAQELGGAAYARALVAVAARLVGPSESSAHPAPAMAAVGLGERVDRVLHDGRPTPGVNATLTSVVAFVVCLSAILADASLRPSLARTAQGRQLLRAVGSESPEERSAALFHLARWQGREDEVAPILARHLGDAERIVDIHRWIYAREGWGPARDVFAYPSPGETAALGLASLGAVAAPILEQRLGDPDPVVRRNAAWGLGELRHPRGVTGDGMRRLITATRDPEPLVRAAAAWALGDIGDVAALPALHRMLARENDARAGQEARASLDALEQGVSLEALRLQPGG